ncbi:hypothetical protein [Lactobacillus hominis]|uniref:Uncharacterized protein n=1 Tax=Lactobacillus hominis DSM 23910 = CRBIP 24.179 TaxID=1423758 RepID=I7L7M8_9LACO|nr:hypothetical protein [Lactobacillus hominis]KRM86231.1 hypothetical protein FC41_GL000428 [Lactobacillus hominis DSM 23910 = CRBIP 24.179]MCT3348546.1 hypothetical protein [Lactobacillus hominis]CCI82732.1 Putative uncharacterized protein [Lactobacillus hominis DSM 23910 = CRBIP 24.179]
MKYYILLNKTNTLGQIPVEKKHKTDFFICGNLDNVNHTIILYNSFHEEIGRLYLDKSSKLIRSYTIDVVHHSLVKVKKVNSHLTNLFYVTRLNYWVSGNIKKGNYSFYSGIKKVASVETLVTFDGTGLCCSIARPEDVPFILLISILFTQWHTTPLKLPQLNLIKKPASA